MRSGGRAGGAHVLCCTRQGLVRWIALATTLLCVAYVSFGLWRWGPSPGGTSQRPVVVVVGGVATTGSGGGSTTRVVTSAAAAGASPPPARLSVFEAADADAVSPWPAGIVWDPVRYPSPFRDLTCAQYVAAAMDSRHLYVPRNLSLVVSAAQHKSRLKTQRASLVADARKAAMAKGATEEEAAALPVAGVDALDLEIHRLQTHIRHTQCPGGAKGACIDWLRCCSRDTLKVYLYARDTFNRTYNPNSQFPALYGMFQRLSQFQRTSFPHHLPAADGTRPADAFVGDGVPRFARLEVVTNADDACVFVPAIDTLCEFNRCEKGIVSLLTRLQHWTDGGTNHLVWEIADPIRPKFMMASGPPVVHTPIGGGGGGSGANTAAAKAYNARREAAEREAALNALPPKPTSDPYAVTPFSAFDSMRGTPAFSPSSPGAPLSPSAVKGMPTDTALAALIAYAREQREQALARADIAAIARNAGLAGGGGGGASGTSPSSPAPASSVAAAAATEDEQDDGQQQPPRERYPDPLKRATLWEQRLRARQEAAAAAGAAGDADDDANTDSGASPMARRPLAKGGSPPALSSQTQQHNSAAVARALAAAAASSSSSAPTVIAAVAPFALSEVVNPHVAAVLMKNVVLWRSAFEFQSYRPLVDLQLPLWPKLDHTSMWNANEKRPFRAAQASDVVLAAAAAAPAASTAAAAASSVDGASGGVAKAAAVAPVHLMVPASQRKYLASFKGMLHNKVNHVRNKLAALHNDKDIIIAPYCCMSLRSWCKPHKVNCTALREQLPKYDYDYLLAQSKFGLVPKGYGAHSYRLLEVIRAGAIPVIVSDMFVLPFDELLNWSTFAIRIPEAELQDLPRILRAIPNAELDRMQATSQYAYHHLLSRRELWIYHGLQTLHRRIQCVRQWLLPPPRPRPSSPASADAAPASGAAPSDAAVVRP